MLTDCSRGRRRCRGSRRTCRAAPRAAAAPSSAISSTSAVVERERAVPAGLGEPEVHELAHLVGHLGGQVVQLRAVDVGVVELPLVVVEVAPPAERRMGRDGLPPVVPDRALAEHRVELRRARPLSRSVVEAVPHADAVEVALDVSLDGLGSLDTEAVEDRRDDVDRVVVLLPDLAPGLASLPATR